MLGQSISQNAISLSIFAIITAGIISITQNTTEAKIEHNIKLAQTRALNEIILPGSYDNPLVEDSISINDQELLAGTGSANAYVARRNGKAFAVILPAVSADGYTANIRSIVGILADGSIAGVRVLSHQETPGLGDKIEVRKSDWVEQFVGKSLTDPIPRQWFVKKDGGSFDQLTGATITPRAVVKSVHRALEYFDAHHKRLLAPHTAAKAQQVVPLSNEKPPEDTP